MKDRTEEEKDILREIGNIGGGNALTSLSMMLSEPLELEVPECKVVEREKAGGMLANPGALYAGVAMTMRGSIDCMLCLLLNRDFTKLIIEKLNEEDLTDIQKLTDMQKSALCEVGNIMGNSYVTAVATLLGRRIVVSVPYIIVDTGERILKSFLNEFSVQSDNFLFINNSFSHEARKLDSYMLLCPTTETLDDIIMKLNS